VESYIAAVLYFDHEFAGGGGLEIWLFRQISTQGAQVVLGGEE
jgi:hypothetical protein